MKSAISSLPEKNFTDHQIEILRLWAEKPVIAQVAAELNVSTNTVQTQLSRMRKKLGVRRTFELYRYALENDYF
ncbi:MAG TPA: helix-turn-helix transcriptional regulator [Flavilitoribacter sp.]|nr:helix-turn-helix transcriptional regulator [Lewinella sp.]HMQ89664.1 helix-turn-helix transcriptional regulator [Flavilitoribacter sp.]